MSSNIVVPELGESIVEARVVKWLKDEGARVSVGEPLVELETDKIDLEVGATQAGVLARITHRAGDDVKVGDVLGVVDADGRSGAAAAPGPAAAPPRETAPASAPALTATAPLGPAPAPATEQAPAEGPPLSPSARRRALAKGSTPEKPPAPPPESRAPAPETRRAPAPQAPAPPPPQAAPAAGRREERIRFSKRRQTIARRLVEAQRTAAMLTTFNEIDMSAVMELRQRHKERFREQFGASLGITSFFVKAACIALKEFPRLNAEVDGDEMVLKHYYDIGVAVGASEGLVVPVLRDADRLTFGEIERRTKDFASRADAGSLTLEDIRGGTFTITNGGVFGSLMSTPILNPPQVGILGLHKIEQRAVPQAGAVVVRAMMYVALSYDHRLVDGLEAVRFLVRIKELVEDPGHLLLDA